MNDKSTIQWQVYLLCSQTSNNTVVQSVNDALGLNYGAYNVDDTSIRASCEACKEEQSWSVGFGSDIRSAMSCEKL